MDLRQKKLFNGTRDFHLNEKDRVIKLKFSTISKTNEETIALYTLDENYERIKYREFKWIVSALPIYALGIKFVIDSFNFPDAFPIFISLFFISIAVFLNIRYFVIQQDQYVFRDYRSKDPVLLIWANKPDEDTSRNFVESISELIRKTKINPKLSANEKLEVYSRHLEFLVDEDVLSEDEAERIFNRTASKIKLNRESVVSLIK